MLLGKALKNKDSRTGRTLLNLFYIQGITVSQELEGNWAALCQLLNSLCSLTILSRLYKGNLKLWSPKYFFLKHPFFMLRFGVHSKWQVVGSWDTHCTQAIPKRTGTSPCGLKFTKSTVFPQKCLCLSECFSVFQLNNQGNTDQIFSYDPQSIFLLRSWLFFLSEAPTVKVSNYCIKEGKD